MDYTSLFYWLVVADNAKTAFLTFAIIFGIISAIAILVNLLNDRAEDEGEVQGISRKWIWWATPFAVVFILLTVFTPSKRDSLLIVAGGGALNFLTTDSSAKQIPHELTTFVVTELKSMAKESEVDLNIQGEKEKIVEEAKQMTAQELMNRMKIDSTFSKVILNK